MLRMDKFDTRMFKAVIVDEAHHASAKSYIKILERFDSRISDAQIDLSELEAPINATPIAPASSAVSDADEPPIRVSEVVARLDEAGEVCSPVLGFTATFSRADGLALGKIFEKIVWHSGWMQMITGGWCVPPRARDSSQIRQVVAASIHDGPTRAEAGSRQGRHHVNR